MSGQHEIRQRVTDQIVTALQTGTTLPWRRPWSATGRGCLPKSAASLNRYTGINVPILNLAAAANGWAGRYWATYNQWRILGCQVRPRPGHVLPGEWGTKIVFCKPVETVTQTDAGEDNEERYFVLREFTVFAAEQVDGAAAERLLAGPAAGGGREIDFGPAEDVLAASGADIRHGGDRAFYCPTQDYVQLPPRATFCGVAGYYSTALHELTHWTGHPARLDRLSRNNRFGDEAYAFEELCAEIGSAHLCSELGVPQNDDLANTVAYLSAWIKALRADPTAIFRAAAMGSRAADYLLAGPSKVRGDAELALAA